MPRRAPVPDGFERLHALSASVRSLRTRIADKEAEVTAHEVALNAARADLAKLRSSLKKEESRFEEFVTIGAGFEIGGNGRKLFPEETAPKGRPKAAKLDPANVKLPEGLPANWHDLDKKWKLAWLLVAEDGQLDYERDGIRIYGFGGQTAKDNVNAIMSALRYADEVEKAPGLRRYRIKLTSQQLIAKSGAKMGDKMPP